MAYQSDMHRNVGDGLGAGSSGGKQREHPADCQYHRQQEPIHTDESDHWWDLADSDLTWLRDEFHTSSTGEDSNALINQSLTIDRVDEEEKNLLEAIRRSLSQSLKGPVKGDGDGVYEDHEGVEEPETPPLHPPPHHPQEYEPQNTVDDEDDDIWGENLDVDDLFEDWANLPQSSEPQAQPRQEPQQCPPPEPEPVAGSSHSFHPNRTNSEVPVYSVISNSLEGLRPLSNSSLRAKLQKELDELNQLEDEDQRERTFDVGTLRNYKRNRVEKINLQFMELFDVDPDLTSNEMADNEVTNPSMLFKGMKVYLHGHFECGNLELRRLIIIHGAEYHHMELSSTTHILIEHLPQKDSFEKRNIPVLHPKWLTHSIKHGFRLPYTRYLHRSAEYDPETSDEDDLEDNDDLADFTFDGSDGPMAIRWPSSSQTQSNGLNKKYSLRISQEELMRPDRFNAFLNQIRGTQPEETTFPYRETLRERQLRGFYDDYDIAYSYRHRFIVHLRLKNYFGTIALREDPDLAFEPFVVTAKCLVREYDDGNDDSRRPSQESHNRSSSSTFSSRDHFPVDVLGTGSCPTKSDDTPTTSSATRITRRVISVSEQATTRGVSEGLLWRDAKRICPELVEYLLPANRCLSASKEVYSIIAQFTHDIEAVSCRELFADFSEVLDECPQCPPEAVLRLVRQLINEFTGFRCTVTMAPNRLFARLVTDTLEPENEIKFLCGDPEELNGFLDALPVERLPGIGPRALFQLKKDFSITHECRSLRAIPSNDFVSHYGRNTGANLFKLVRGIEHDEPARERNSSDDQSDSGPPSKSPSSSMTSLFRRSMAAAIIFRGPLAARILPDKLILDLCEDLSQHLHEVKSCGGRRLTLIMSMRRTREELAQSRSSHSSQSVASSQRSSEQDRNPPLSPVFQLVRHYTYERPAIYASQFIDVAMRLYRSFEPPPDLERVRGFTVRIGDIVYPKSLLEEMPPEPLPVDHAPDVTAEEMDLALKDVNRNPQLAKNLFGYRPRVVKRERRRERTRESSPVRSLCEVINRDLAAWRSLQGVQVSREDFSLFSAALVKLARLDPERALVKLGTVLDLFLRRVDRDEGNLVMMRSDRCDRPNDWQTTYNTLAHLLVTHGNLPAERVHLFRSR